jgi:hypothetical protein
MVGAKSGPSDAYFSTGRLAAVLAFGAAVGTYVICTSMGWRRPDTVRQIDGDLLINLIAMAVGAALVVSAITAISGGDLPLLRSLDRIVWRSLIAGAMAGIWALLWWPELKTVWLVVASGLGVLGAFLARMVVGEHQSAACGIATLGSAVLFALGACDLLGLGDYGAGPIVYALGTGVTVAVLFWFGHRIAVVRQR